MTAKEYLGKIERDAKSIRRIECTIKEIRLSAGGARAIDYTRDKVQSSPSNYTEDLIIKAMDLTDKLTEMKRHYMDEIELITSQINNLSNPLHADILYKKYVEFKSLEQVAVEVHLSYHYVKHQHGWALVAFEKSNTLLKDDTQ